MTPTSIMPKLAWVKQCYRFFQYFCHLPNFRYPYYGAFRCNGGDPYAAWRYWTKTGIVTGSNYTTNAGCKPYPFPPCEHHSNKTHYDPCKHDLFPTPKCERTCVPTYKDRSYDADKYYGRLGGGHAVKMIGWGVDQGFFRILRGVDECGIESGVVGGIPKLNEIPFRRHDIRSFAEDAADVFF
ncbi:unnamed protein product [Strongylus vulgaris]|uniref:Peptidase C1A papain C-terminal domain-containing protein n=1 Tax=Strongylus vulgaris TaxID=40348 RepID=A0A3P7J2U8_STRVU|nr:unnamed protein product [Strongylus vulgaris]